jgi:hypothetical protein
MLYFCLRGPQAQSAIMQSTFIDGQRRPEGANPPGRHPSFRDSFERPVATALNETAEALWGNPRLGAEEAIAAMSRKIGGR